MDRHSVNPGALANLGIPLLRGRDLSWRDDATARSSPSISEGVANRLWPGKDPIGNACAARADITAWVTVVGVARDARQAQRFDLNEVNSGIPAAALGRNTTCISRICSAPSQLVTVALRVAGDVTAVSRELKKACSRSIQRCRSSIWRCSMIGLASQLAPSRLIAEHQQRLRRVALFLAAFGLFAVLAYDVSQRVHEMGVRMALGAQRGDVLRLVLREGVAFTVAGLLCGSVEPRRRPTLEAFLFGVSPSIRSSTRRFRRS